MSEGSRLSESQIWSELRSFFDDRGVSAWRERIVPTEAPNSPAVAHAYVQILTRLAAEQAESDQPLYVLELGAGSGCFGFTFLTMLDAWRERTGRKGPPICYVLTDVARSNVAFWREHTALAPLFERGVLDCAQLDALNPTGVELEISGLRLAPESLAHPLVVVGNYLFDSLPADAFRVSSGRLEEGLAKLGTGDEPRVSFEYEPAAAAPYGDPELDPILDRYRAILGDTAFTFPIGAVRCLRGLQRLSPRGLFILATDKGYTEEHQLRGLASPSMTPHGDGFSMTVNFHALGRWVEARGGRYDHTRGRPIDLQTVMLSLGDGALSDARTAFYEAIEVIGPVDLFTLVHDGLETVTTLDQCLALLQLSSADPSILLRLSEPLRSLVPEADERQRQRLRALLRRAATLFYPLDPERDVYLEIGTYFAAMNRFAEARHFLESSLEHFGPKAITYFSLGLCSFELGSPRDALRQLDTALSLEPTFAMARDWRLRVRAELDDQSSPPEGQNTR